MMSLAIFIATVIFDYLLVAVLVGISFYAVFGKSVEALSVKKTLVVLFFVFALLDVYYLPALFSLQMTVTIGNEQVRELLDLDGPIDMGELFSPRLLDFFLWFLQAIVGQVIGRKVYSLRRA